MLKYIATSLIAMFAFSTPALSAGPAEDLIVSAATEVFLDKAAANPEPVLAAIDFDAVARFTLGRHGRTLADNDLATFQTALREQISQTYRSQLGKYPDAQLRVLGSTDRNERDSIVRTELARVGKRPVDVNWRVMKRNGEWRVVDVQFSGVWLAIEQRAQFAAILDRPGADISTVISALRG